MRSLALAALVVAGLSIVPASAGALSLGGLTVLPAAPTTYLVGLAGTNDAGVVGLLASVGATVTRTLSAIDVLQVSSTLDIGLLLAAVPGVAYVEKDTATRVSGAQWNGAQWDGAQWNGAQWDGAQWNGAQWDGAQWNGAQWDAAGASTDPGAASQWGLAAVDAPLVLAPIVAHARLCVVDSGVDRSHPDLAASLGPGYNAITGSSNADDDAGHGTHMAGIAAAIRGNGVGIVGVSDATILSAKVLDASGRGKVSDLAAGMLWCADEGHADVALLALSTDGAPQTITRAIGHLASRNVIMVASAGNGGPTSGVAFPARDPRVIAVAAIDATGATPSFSARGPEVALAAPGVSIVSTYDGATYRSGSGTSQAAAWVAGAAALLRDGDTQLPSDVVRALLTSTARDLGTPGRDDATGAGLLDVSQALAGGLLSTG